MYYSDLALMYEEELGCAGWGRLMAEEANAVTMKSSENSIARRQAQSGDPILPIGAEAFESGHYDLECLVLHRTHQCNSPRSFFKSFGIIIAEESELTGWHKCRLPEGWTISYDDAPDTSHDESVHYIMPDGTEAFHLISHKKNATSITSIAIPHNIF